MSDTMLVTGSMELREQKGHALLLIQRMGLQRSASSVTARTHAA